MKNLISAFLILFATFAVTLSATNAQSVGGGGAAERITDFDVTLTVNEDGSYTVVERISVFATGAKIKRGIFRDFPLTFVDADGDRKKVTFEVTSVTRNGVPDNFWTETKASYARTFIGKEDVFLARGPYRYEITYNTDRQFRYLKDHDEIAWNVTGNFWEFQIDKASATIILPDGVRAKETDFFTGIIGSKDKNARVETRTDGSLYFETTSPLNLEEGLTIVAKLAKGSIPTPSDAQRSAWFWLDFGAALITAAAAIIGFLYYVVTWFKAGRDPELPTIVPRWSIDPDISPAMVDYIANEGLSNNGMNAMSAALVNLAVKGHVVLSGFKKNLKVTLTGKEAKEEEFPKGEYALLDALEEEKSGDSFTFSQAKAKETKSIVSVFSSVMNEEHAGKFHEANIGFIVLGFLIVLAGFIGGLFFVSPAIDWAITLGLLGAGFITLGYLLFLALLETNQRRSASSALVRGLALIAIAAAAIVGMTYLVSILSKAPLSVGEQIYTMASLAAFTAFGVYCRLIAAPTSAGAEKLAEIEGLKMYLTYSEKDRMAMAGAPSMSPQHFETLLPFAMALGVEKHWNKTFDDWLKSAEAKNQGYNDSYRNSWSRGDYRTAAAAGIGTVMASSLASAMPVEKSSSSSSSGGGGGGGGGGGW